MKKIGTADLRRNLSGTLDKVKETGESLIVTRKGREIVKICPLSTSKNSIDALIQEIESIEVKF